MIRDKNDEKIFPLSPWITMLVMLGEVFRLNIVLRREKGYILKKKINYRKALIKRPPWISAHLSIFRNGRLFELEFDKNELEGSITD